MRTSSLASAGFHARKPPPRNRSTAFYLFDRNEASNFYKIKLNATHFRAYNKTLNLPIATDGSAEDMDRLTNEMIPTAGTPYQIMRHYMDGADIQFHVQGVPEKIYKLIVNHLNAHLEAMRTDVTYQAPPAESFEEWGEFALALRPMALSANKHLESPVSTGGFSFLARRPSFSSPDEIKPTERSVLPQSTRVLNSISSYLEKINEW